MKNLFNVHIARILGIVLFTVVIGLSTTAAQSRRDSRGGGSASAAGITSVTITNIPSQYNRKFAMLLIDSGNTTQRWGMLTISGTSATFNLLDWVTDEASDLDAGNYSVTLVIGEDMTAIANSQYLFAGTILSKALSGRTVSIRLNEFTTISSASEQMSVTIIVTGIPVEYDNKYALTAKS